MIGAQDVENLKKFAAEGRGLWIGLVPTFVDRHPCQEHFGENPHLTLVHLGKKVSADEVDVLCQMLDLSFRGRWPAEGILARVTGAGWFYRWKQPNALIALVNSAALFQMRAWMMDRLQEDEVRFKDDYGFIPHLTMRDSTTLEDVSRMFDCSPARVRFEDAIIKCGECQVSVVK